MENWETRRSTLFQPKFKMLRQLIRMDGMVETLS